LDRHFRIVILMDKSADLRIFAPYSPNTPNIHIASSQRLESEGTAIKAQPPYIGKLIEAAADGSSGRER